MTDQVLEKPFSSYREVAQPVLKKLISQHDDLREDLKKDMLDLKFDIDPEAEVKAGRLDEDDIYVPVRTILALFRRKMAAFHDFLTRTPITAAFLPEGFRTMEDLDVVSPLIIETVFTRWTRYQGWFTTLARWAWGGKMSCYDVIKLVADNEAPAKYKFEYVGKHNLAIPEAGRDDIQLSPFLAEAFHFTCKQLHEFSMEGHPMGFDREQIMRIIGRPTEDHIRDDPSAPAEDITTDAYEEKELWKVYYKENGMIHYAWAAPELCEEWIKKPEPFNLGRFEMTQDEQGNPVPRPVYEDRYPYFLYVSDVESETDITKHQSFVQQERPRQDAVTALWTIFTSQSARAGEPIWTPKNDAGRINAEEAQLQIKPKPKHLFMLPVQPELLPPPPLEIVSAAEKLLQAGQHEQGDVNYATQTNQSTRKTAQELKQAASTQGSLDSSDLMVFSVAYTDALQFMWELLQTRIAAGALEIPQEAIPVFLRRYTILPGGSIYVMEREQKIQNMLQLMGPAVQAGIGQMFFTNILRLMFPEESPMYLQGLRMESQRSQALKSALAMLQGLMFDEETGEVTKEIPEGLRDGYKKQYEQLQQVAAQPL